MNTVIRFARMKLDPVSSLSGYFAVSTCRFSQKGNFYQMPAPNPRGAGERMAADSLSNPHIDIEHSP
jgi:hypothetical protein